MENTKLTYDIVIATRNRTDALKMAIPLMISQSRQAEKLIIVDSSDNHDSIKTVVESLTADWDKPVKIVHTSPNLTRQRNIGLKHVTADVVMYPDDDSLWHPGVAEYTMRAYEADKEGIVGGVCAKPVTHSPLEDNRLEYKKSRFSILKTITQPARNAIEESLFPKPFNLFAYDAWKDLPELDWLEKHNCIVVENMAGFRMSFRTSALKRYGFDEAIGTKVGYAVHEDMEASVNTLKHGYHLVAALDAKVFHHAHYTQRAKPFSYGFCQIANYLYIVRKHMEPGAKPWNACKPFLFYKLFIYSTSAYKPYGREILKGAQAAWKERNTILDTPLENLEETYYQIFDKYHGGQLSTAG